MVGSRIDRALRKGEDFFESGMIFNEVALCMKTEHIKDMVRFCDEKQTETDHEIANWARMKRLKIRYPIPSLIDHRDDVESIYRSNYNLPKADKPRKAYLYADNQK
jgi:hypothetical protein